VIPWAAVLGRRRTLPLSGDPARVPADRPPGPVDVVVPVYGAAAELDACLGSVLAHTNLNIDLARHRLVLVVDGPQQAAVEEVLARVGPKNILLLRNPERRGFVASANRGMATSDRDVVLLNSDTRVVARWLDNLQEAAYSAPEIATVTPFSNDATICSLPRWLAANALPAGWDLDAFAALVERAAARERPRLPTGVGVCLYIKRKVLDLLGPFDEAHFGLGYGEESEFCTRALKAGFAHVLDDATFILHAGSASFGPKRKARVRAAHRVLRRLHPEYLPTVARFLREDPLRLARERVLAALREDERGKGPRPVRPSPAGPRRVLHLVHGWPPWSPAGTEVYARGLVLRQAGVREVTVYARIADPRRRRGEALELLDGGARVRLTVNNFTQRDPFSRNAFHDRRLAADFGSLLAEVRPDLLHVHHLAGHAADLPLLAARRGVPYLYQVQDWWAPCARANLFDAARRLCAGPEPAKCTRCLPLTGLPPAPLANRALYRHRARLLQRVLAGAEALVMGSRAIVESYRDLGWLPAGVPVHVLPYGVELPEGSGGEVCTDRPPGSPLRLGYIGSLLPHKGVHLAVAAMAGIDPSLALLRVWGDPAADPGYVAELRRLAGRANVRFEGRFPEAEKSEVFAGLDVLLVPSLGLESFGLVAREALAHGVPVVASRRGALRELFEGGGESASGTLFDPDDPGALAGWMARLAADPGIVAAWRRHLPPVKGMDEHAQEIEAIYDAVLSASPPADRRAGR
jgi:glycosyltransferase involved in cell wall biosynthesis/CTP:molybdopterin cytidylyltransferase MocA